MRRENDIYGQSRDESDTESTRPSSNVDGVPAKCGDFRLFERETNLTSRMPVSDVDPTSKGLVRSDSLGSTTRLSPGKVNKC